MSMPSWFRIQNIPWKICFEAGKRSLRDPSIDYWGVLELFGNEAILIGLCGMRNIFEGYIRRNPEKARLTTGEYILYESDLAKQIE